MFSNDLCVCVCVCGKAKAFSVNVNKFQSGSIPPDYSLQTRRPRMHLYHLHDALIRRLNNKNNHIMLYHSGKYWITMASI